MYLGDKIEWPLFYDQMAREVNIWDEMKENDEALKPIVNKWGKRKRRKEMTFLCYSVIRSSHDHIEKTFYVANNLSDFGDKRVAIQLKVVSYLRKYKNKKFYFFPHALDRKNKLKNKDE